MMHDRVLTPASCVKLTIARTGSIMARVTPQRESTLANPPDQRATPAPRRASAQLEYADAPLEGRRPALLLAAAAGLCWACAIALLLSGGLDAETEPLATQRVIFYVLVLAAGLLTFVPIQQRLGLPGL